MTEEALRYFSRMFEANRHMSEAKWFDQFPMYQHDLEMGVKPWFPPLSEVFYVGESCPYDHQSAAALAWPDAWQLLQKHYQEYLTAKQQRRTSHAPTKQTTDRSTHPE